MEEFIPDHPISSAYFVGDVHLDSRVPDRERSFLRFLDRILRERPDALFLMGDIFEFWFGYKTVMFSQTIRTVSRIAAIRDAGIQVFYIVGNHDFEPGPVFEEILDIRIMRDPVVVTLGDQRVYLSHGDEINVRDKGYRFLKKILRNSLAQSVFKLIPASIAWYIGRYTSDTSRRLTDLKPQIPDDVYGQFFSQLTNNHIQVVIHGHTHRPERKTVSTEHGDLLFINSGHWFGPGHYIHYTGREFLLEEFPW